MNLIDTAWWNALGAILFLAVIVAVVWCWRDASKETEAPAAEDLQQGQFQRNVGVTYYEAG